MISYELVVQYVLSRCNMVLHRFDEQIECYEFTLKGDKPYTIYALRGIGDEFWSTDWHQQYIHKNKFSAIYDVLKEIEQ